MYPFIQIFGRTLPTYSLCILTGILLASPALIFLAKKFSVKIDDSIYSFIYAFIGVIIGAKLFFIIVNLRNIPSIIKEFGFTTLLRGGFIIYGGLAGGFIFAWIYCHQFHISPLPIFSLLITIVPLIQCTGRLGCLLAGCCYGIPHDGFFSVCIDGIQRFPVQILCSILDFILFIVLILRAIFSKQKFLQLPIYMTFYSVGRFCVEFLRGDTERGFLGFFSTSQWLSILFFATGLILLQKLLKLPPSRINIVDN